MSAPNLKEIEWAISELEKEESSFPLYAKLANLYTVRKELLGLSVPSQISAYSEAPPPITENNILPEYGNSDFLRAAAGKEASAVWVIIDDLMDSLKIVNQKVYDGVMRKIRAL